MDTKSSLRALAFLAVVTSSGLAVAGCGGDNMTSEDAAPDAADSGVDSGGRCTPGELDCECDSSGACTTGYCIGDVCTDCRIASDGCVCRSNGTCDTGLRCSDTTELCEPCPEGEESCACRADSTCDTGLVCSGGLCVPDTCTDGTVGCPCRSTAMPCDTGAYCDGSGLCQTCASDVAGCPCDAGACTGGLVCDSTSTTCRDAVTCADLRGSGACGEFQQCDEAPGADAVCVDMTCITGYRWHPSDSTCVMCVSPDCSAEPTCTTGLPNTLDCSGEHRVCEEVDGFASCGACDTGYSEVGGVCIELGRCGATLCAVDQYCDTTNPAGPTCTAWPCPSRNQVVGSDGTCSVTCTRSCDVEGSTGRYWPYADEGDACVCETIPGYYFDNGGESIPVACDADGDGWVRLEVRQILDHTPPDDAIIANARCDVHSVSVVELRDEYGNASQVESCDEGLLQNRTGGTCTPFPLRLFESKRNDVAGEAARLGEAPPYASGGRRFRPEELNGLTKACVDALGDFDDDDIEDIRQTQPIPADTSSLGETARLRSFAHFIELYRTAYVPPVGPALDGTLVIQERSRCDAAFPITYGSTGTYDPDTDPTYWRNCERRRGPGFDADAALPTPGYDFAQYTCSARSGSCPAPAVPAHPTFSMFPSLPTLVRDHGLCELGGTTPADGVFRGMHHHSQFQCVQVVADGTSTLQSYQRTRSTFGGTSLTTTGPATSPSSATLTFNACQVQDCAGATGCTDSSAPGDGSSNPWDPSITCSVAATGTTPVLPAMGAVGWAAVRYQTYGELTSTGTPLGDTSYNGGCVNEQAEWPGLCPQSLFGICNAGEVDAFGRYCCYGCGSGCTYAHAGGYCRLRTCHLGTCDPGWGNCDSMEGTGCENSLDSLTHCGTCGTPCSRANATASCSGDSCHIASCNTGFDNCDGMDPNGCENTLDSITDCGTCGTACSTTNSTPNCSGDSCHIGSCNANYYDLNGGLDCECQESPTLPLNTSCSAAYSFSPIASGSTSTVYTQTGTIPYASSTSYDWYVATFPGTGGRPTIDFSSNGGNEFRFDVFVTTSSGGCPASGATATACRTGAGASEAGSNLTSWEYYDGDVSGSGYGTRDGSYPWPEKVYVRVHRASATTTCPSYTLRVRRL